MLIKRITFSLLILSCLSSGLYCYEKPLSLVLEVAITPQQKLWGLMGRRSLPADAGMLFLYEKPAYVNVWMFNCYIDLDVAYLDAKGRLLQIATLKAYPEAMDPKRPIHNAEDLKLYPDDDPVRLFFQSRSFYSKGPVRGFLEVNAGWFAAHGVKKGDTLVKDGNQWRIEKRRQSRSTPYSGF